MNNREPYEYGQNNSDKNGSGPCYGSSDFPKELGKFVNNAMNLGTTIMREMNREFSEFSDQIPGQMNFNNQPGSQQQQQVDELRRSAQNLGNTVMREVSRGMDGLSDRIRSASERPRAAAPNRPQKAAPARMVPAYQKRPLKAPSKIIAALSYLVGTAGAVGTLAFGCMTTEFIYHMDMGAAFTAGTLLGVSLLAAVQGLRSPGRARRRFRYRKAMGTDTAIPLSRLAESARCSLKRVKRDVSLMIRKNILPEGYIDDEENILFLSAEEYREFQRDQEQRQKKAEAKPRPGEELLSQMEDFVRLMDEHIAQNEQELILVDRLRGLRRAMTDILSWVKNHPGSMNQVRRLTSYYMPTTLKLLSAYEDAKNQPGETAAGIRRDVTGALQNIKNGFENLRTSLLTDTALDVAAEISAVQTMLVQDGMADPILEFKE